MCFDLFCTVLHFAAVAFLEANVSWTLKSSGKLLTEELTSSYSTVMLSERRDLNFKKGERNCGSGLRFWCSKCSPVATELCRKLFMRWVGVHEWNAASCESNIAHVYPDGNVRWLRRVLPLISHVEYAPRALLRLGKKMGQADGRMPNRDALRYDTIR